MKDGYRLYEDLAYGPSLGERGENLLDLYQPRGKTAKRRPMVVWVHGGGWYQGSKRGTAPEKARSFVRRGFVFAALNYRLSPRVQVDMGYPRDRVRHPAAATDVARAVAWLSAKAGRYGVDRRRVILMGHSAGAQTVSMLGADPRYLTRAGFNPAWLRGVIALDPVGLDLARLAEAPERAGEDTAGTYRKMVWNAFAAPWEPGYDAIIRNSSPVTQADRFDPPFLTVTSATSPPRTREGIRMSRLLGQIPALGAWNVSLGHRDINIRFGDGTFDEGATRRAFRFARWVASGRSARAWVRGRSIYRLNRVRSRKLVRLKLNMSPASSYRGLCRIDRLPTFRCRSSVQVLAGQGRHRLAVRAMDPTGRFGRKTVFRFRVLPRQPS